jgi:hypothetical protein
LEISANQLVNTIIPSNDRGHNLKANDGRIRPDSITAIKTALDESGVVGITCCHGVNVTFLNIYGDGKRRSHGIRCIEAVMQEVSHFAELKLCYDVASVFESALYCYNQDWKEVVEVRIGRLHIFGHQYWCHVLYNLLHLANYGLMGGEDPEQLWYMMQYFIQVGRVSSSSLQMQKIYSFGRYWPI